MYTMQEFVAKGCVQILTTPLCNSLMSGHHICWQQYGLYMEMSSMELIPEYQTYTGDSIKRGIHYMSVPEPHRLLKYVVHSRHANTSECQRCKESHDGVVVKKSWTVSCKYWLDKRCLLLVEKSQTNLVTPCWFVTSLCHEVSKRNTDGFLEGSSVCIQCCYGIEASLVGLVYWLLV